MERDSTREGSDNGVLERKWNEQVELEWRSERKERLGRTKPEMERERDAG